MKDNIKPEHYRTGEIDLYEAWYQTYPFEQYRAIMQAVAERYMRRDKNDRIEDIGKAIYTLERLKEKEIEHRDGQVRSKDEVIDSAIEFMNEHDNQECISLLKSLLFRDFKYVARDSDGELSVFDGRPVKFGTQWSDNLGRWNEPLNTYYFPEVQWTDEEPTRIAELLESYENGGENGKQEG